MGTTTSRNEIINHNTPSISKLKLLKTILEEEDHQPIYLKLGQTNVPLSSLQLNEIIVNTIALKAASPNIYELFDKIDPILDSLALLDTDTDPELIEAATTEFLTDLVNQTGDLSNFDLICLQLREALPTLAPIFADWLGNLLSEEGTSKVILELTELGAHESFSLIRDFYYSLSPELQSSIDSPENMADFLHQCLLKIRFIINELNEFDLQHVLLSKLIEEQFAPAIAIVSKIQPKIFKWIFIILSINQFCTQSQEIANLGPIAIIAKQHLTSLRSSHNSIEQSSTSTSVI